MSLTLKWLGKPKRDEEIYYHSQQIRLVAKGYAHKRKVLISEEEAFALVARLEAVRLFILLYVVKKILKKHGMTSCDSIGTPMASKPTDAASVDTGFELTAFSDSDHAGHFLCLDFSVRGTSLVAYQFLGGDKLVSCVHLKWLAALQCSEKPISDLFTKAFRRLVKSLVRTTRYEMFDPDEPGGFPANLLDPSNINL
ncbi:hypothetical protein Tco_0802420 [Tanacetum coccineum]|uniref:Uncharacterized protein n=1 Tax=Tanacetum coccineum TaxID=301880 RepID=A0ABQ5A2D9_9ASTR